MYPSGGTLSTMLEMIENPPDLKHIKGLFQYKDEKTGEIKDY